MEDATLVKNGQEIYIPNLPEPYYISFDIVYSELVRGNIFRPMQPYKLVTPGIEMINAPIVWVGYVINLINNGKIPKDAVPLFLDPIYGEFKQGIFWILFNRQDLMVGRDWPCANPNQWLFTSTMDGRKRRWADNISIIIKKLSTSEYDEDVLLADLLSLFGKRFIKHYQNAMGLSLDETINENLIPSLQKIRKSSTKENKMRLLLEEIISFIQRSFLEVRDYYAENSPEELSQKYYSTNIIDNVYNLYSFVEDDLGVTNLDKQAIGELESLGKVVNQQNPKFDAKEICQFFSRLNTTVAGRKLFRSFVLFNYLAYTLKKRYKSEIDALRALKYDDVLLEALKCAKRDEKSFNNFLKTNSIFPRKELQTVNYGELLQCIELWEFNFFLYFGEVLIRNGDRNLVLNKGIKEKNLKKTLEIQSLENKFVYQYLHDNKNIVKMEELKKLAREIKSNLNPRQNELSMLNFINTLLDCYQKYKVPHRIYIELLETMGSFNYSDESSRLIVSNNIKETFSEVSYSVVFPGRDGIVNWLLQLKEMV